MLCYRVDVKGGSSLMACGKANGDSNRRCNALSGLVRRGSRCRFNAMGGKLWAAEEFRAFHPAPLVKIVMSFRIQEVDATHCLLTTETRVYAAGTHVLRGFATYWRMIYPGSALIRREWLRAIKLRAEAVPEARTASGTASRAMVNVRVSWMDRARPGRRLWNRSC